MGINPSFPIAKIPRERIIVITGANSGIGYQIAKWCAMMGATVIMACRSGERAKKAIHRINEEFVVEKAKGIKGLQDVKALALEFMELRLDSFKSVMKFVEDFKQSGRQLHVLFCNAGIAFSPYKKTEDGLETVLQVNYLSHFLLVCKLLPLMKLSGPDCRVLFMSSLLHKWCTFDENTINYTGPEDKYDSREYYGRSKVYQIMQMYSMHKRLQGSNINVNSIHPGPVNTNIAEDPDTIFLKFFVFIFKTFGFSPERAAKCSINCATNPRLSNTSGIYFVDFCRTRPSSTARGLNPFPDNTILDCSNLKEVADDKSKNENYQDILWKTSFDLIKDYVTEEERACMEGK